jgi:hypothetical protein
MWMHGWSFWLRHCLPEDRMGGGGIFSPGFLGIEGILLVQREGLLVLPLSRLFLA